MIRRAACLSIFLTLVLLPSFGSESQIDQHGQLNARSGIAQRNAAIRKSGVRGRAAASARKMSANPSPSQIGFLGANQTFAGGSTSSNFPAVLGDFTGSGKKVDVATVVATTGVGYQISVALSNGDGTFTIKSTTTTSTDPNPDPIWVGDMNGDGKDDILMGHQATATTAASVDVWLSNGDGTFTLKGNTAVTTIVNDAIVWATVADVNGDKKVDFVVADAAGPNGSIWTLLGNGDGTFGAPTAVAFTGQLSLNNPVVFADFNGDGILDFAGASASNNQIEVYLANNPAPGYQAPVPLTTPDGVYDSCFLTGGKLATSTDLVSANCTDNTVTVYVNTGTGGAFNQGVYYPSASALLTPAQPGAVAIADVNGDGKNDILVTDEKGSDVLFLQGNGDGTVDDPTVGYAVGGSPQTPAVAADFNGDGKADVIVLDGNLNFAYLQGYGDGSFRSAVNYYAQPVLAGTGQLFSVGIASGDFNGDGIPDFVIGNGQTGIEVAGITVFLSNPDGSLQPGVRYGSATAPNYEFQYVAVGDFNGDGKLDIAATDGLSGGVQIFTGKGDGTFTAGATFATETTGTYKTLGLVAGDFNGDGHPDLAVVNSTGTSTDVGILLNDAQGHGSFTLKSNSVLSTPLSTSAQEITAADVNGDKKLDVVVPLSATPASASGAVAVLLGNGDGTLQAENDASLGGCIKGQLCQFPIEAAVADVNGDGKPDLVVTINDQTITQGIVVALGKGDGTFLSPVLFPSSLNQSSGAPDPIGVKIVDLNRDGHPDVVCTNSKFGTVSVLYGKGDGTFYDPIEFAAGRLPYDLAIADVNADGTLDVVASGNADDFSGVTVLLNTSADSILVPTSSPNPSEVGTSVTFSTTVTGSKVRGAPALTGSVTFLDGTTSLGSAPVNSSGQASLTLTKGLTVGSHSITAQYSDPHYLTVTSSALTQVVTAVPDYTLSANPTSATVNPGSAANYVITLTRSNGYDGTVTFACPSSLPSGVSCNNPSIGPGTTTATLTVSTTGPSAVRIGAPDLNRHDGGSNLWASLGGIGLVGMVLAGDWKKRNHRAMGIGLTVLAVAMILALVGCGGGSSSGGGGGGGGGGTPAGTYQLQVSATGTAGTNGGNTSPHSLPLTLIVQ
jgi:hypothetical protein